jgi:hypothetical protein
MRSKLRGYVWGYNHLAVIAVVALGFKYIW